MKKTIVAPLPIIIKEYFDREEQKRKSRKKIRCESCDGDLSTTRNAISWRIKVENEPILSVTSEVDTDVIEPQVRGKCFFCGLGCLKSWVDKHLITWNKNYARDKIH